MKVILIETIDKIGIKGDVINVKRGFARNYLIPRDYAIYATPQNLKNLDSLKVKFVEEENKRFAILKALGEKVAEQRLTFLRKTDEHENMYGSVSEIDILHALQEKNVDIPKAAIIMEKHIKQLGEFQVNVKLHKDINVTLYCVVEKEND